MKNRFGTSRWLGVASIGLLVCAAAVLAVRAGCRHASADSAVSYAEARAVVERHCISCHSARPTVPAFPIAPKGVMLDTAEQMRKYAPQVKIRTVVDRTMPLLNKTGMTDEEREILGRWVESGAASR